jgi:hypothetical protein
MSLCRLGIQCRRAGSNLVPIRSPTPAVSYRYPSRGSVAILPKALPRDTLFSVRRYDNFAWQLRSDDTSSRNQRWSATHSTEPLYVVFSSTESMNTWMALLRSYAIPEVYGKSHTHWGGTYRIWRQVELTCVQGRNIGVPRSVDPSSIGPTASDPDGRGDVESVDLDLFCEVYFNNVLSGRTVVKKSMGSPDWHEIFLFTDLPPFDKLAIVIWREKRQQKPAAVGTVCITLTNFRRGEHVEGWFPILFGGATTACTQVGQLRLKLRVDELAVSFNSSAITRVECDPGKSCCLTRRIPRW